jgi:hypothetical protein
MRPMSKSSPDAASVIVDPFIPAFRIRKGSSCAVCFRCPSCGRVHAHGCADGYPIQPRGSHCPRPELGWTSYRLIVVGEISSTRMLPRLSVADIRNFNQALTTADFARQKALSSPTKVATAEVNVKQ